MRRKMITLFSLLAALISSVDFADAEASEIQDTPAPQIRETSLCPPLPEGYKIIPASIKISPDLRFAAYAAFSDNTRNIVVTNGNISPVYYAIYPGTPTISAFGNRYAYIAYKTKNQAIVVVDGQASEIFEIADNFIFSPDGSRYAFRAQKNNKQFVVLDGAAGPAYDGILIKKNFLFSPDSHRFIYVAYKDNASVAVVDGKEEANAYNVIEDVIFSPDSSRYAYKGRVEKTAIQEKWRVVTDGTPGPIVDQIFDIVFSYDSKQIAYPAVKNRKMVIVLNNRQIAEGDNVGLPVFSWDSNRLAYALAKKKDWFIIVDDDKSPSFSQVYKFQFSFDSSRYSYIANDGDAWICVVDGQKGPKFKTAIDVFKFSLDSKRYAYAGISPAGAQIVTEKGPSQTIYASIGEPYFSPDSRHLIFRARHKPGGKWITVLDGRERFNAYHAIGKYKFSSNSNHFAVPVFESLNQIFMLVDGHEQCSDHYFRILGDPYFNPDGDYVAYHAMKAANEFYLVVNGIVCPDRYGGFMKDTPIIFDDKNSFHTLAFREPGPEFILIEGEIPDTFPKLSSGLD